MTVKPLNTILVVIGLVLVSLNLGLGVYATGQVAAAVEEAVATKVKDDICDCLLYTSPSPRDDISSRMPSSA